MPARAWIKVVSPEWVDNIAAHRPSVANLWQVAYNAWARVQSGDLILLKRRGSVQDIIGFGTVYCRFPDFTSVVWERYGFGNGANDEAELQERVMRQRWRSWTADPVIGNILIHDLVLFTDRPFKLFQQSPVLQGHHPRSPITEDLCNRVTDDIATHVSKSGFDEAPASAGFVPPSDARFRAWEDGVRSAYRQSCAITKIRAGKLLKVVAIRPSEFGGPLQVSNGVLLELRLATLANEKLISFHVNGALLVSPDLALEDPGFCHDICCKILKSPANSDERLAREHVEWRLANYFRR